MRLTILGIFLIFSAYVNSQEVVFDGYPVKRIEINESSTSTTQLTEAQSDEFKVIIIKDGEDYYWGSRGNIPLVRRESGAYVTYVAVNGSGYVRTLQKEFREMYKKLPHEEKAKQYIYLEHLIHQMGSITYYGR